MVGSWEFAVETLGSIQAERCALRTDEKRKAQRARKVFAGVYVVVAILRIIEDFYCSLRVLYAYIDKSRIYA